MALARFLIFGTIVLSLVGGTGMAAEPSPQARIGRVSLADGGISVRAASKEWVDAGPNDPIVAGMAVRTPPQSRAMLRVGAEIVALDSGTELEIKQLDESGTQILLRRGRVGVRLSALDPARSIEIDIPRGSVWLLTPGDYDIAAGDEHDGSRLLVLDGRARFVGKDGDAAVSTGSVAVLRAGGAVQTSPDGRPADAFTAWWRPKTGMPGDLPALRYVSAEMTGFEDLDAHGGWDTVDGYGAVWFPNELPDNWAPFRYGHWRWLAPWGWTWIDDAAWGFAPSHFGRWVKVADAASETGPSRWGWVPGDYRAHPAYAPAVVAFLGTAGVGLSCPDTFSPGVAWFPLAPGEIYWPSYTDDRAAIRRLNDGVVDDLASLGSASSDDPPPDVVTGEYRNRRYASVVPRSVFLGGKPVAPSLIALPNRRLDNAPLLAGSPQILPPDERAVARAAVLPVELDTPKIIKALTKLARFPKPHPPAAHVREAAAAAAHAPKTADAKPHSLRARAIAAAHRRAKTLRQADARR
jgi:hypothetical protein